MKRLITFVLIAALLVCLLPLGAIPARAKSELRASADMVEILKKLEGFSAKPYWDNSQYTVGYGTRPLNQEDLDRYLKEGISKEEAEELLYHYLDDMGAELNAFADKHGITFTQGQFDCMLSLTFNCGSRWMYETDGTLYAAIKNLKTGNDLLFAVGQWSTSSGVTSRGLVRRRLIEANMYLNNTYEMTVPENYCYVVHDNNGGTADIKVQAYNSDTPAKILSVPTREGYTFDGWYTQAEGGTKVTVLDASVRNMTIYAHWIAGENSGGTGGNGSASVGGTITDSNQNKPGGEPAGIKVTVTASDVNIRQGPGTAYAVVGKGNPGDQLLITDIATGGGYTWGKCEKGWIVLKYTNYSSVAGDSGTETPPSTQITTPASGTVTGDYLRIRKGAGTSYGIVGFYHTGDPVKILECKSVGSTLWGKTDKGWISMDYVKLGADSGSQTPETPKNMGTITGTSLRIRSGAGTNYEVLGYLNTGDRVEILEQKTVGTMVWGRISKGWISMDYVKLDNANQPQKIQATVMSGVTLRVRTGPGTTYAIAAYLSGGDKVTVLETRTVSDTVWARVEKGWVVMSYLVTDGSAGQKPDSTVIKGTVTADSLRIRSGAGLNHQIVGRLFEGAKVEILETKVVEGTTWGRVEKGWISMEYVKTN